MKLDGKNIICVCVLVFYNSSFACYYYYIIIVRIKNVQNLLKNLTIVKTNEQTDNVFTIKSHNRFIHSNF